MKSHKEMSDEFGNQAVESLREARQADSLEAKTCHAAMAQAHATLGLLHLLSELYLSGDGRIPILPPPYAGPYVNNQR
jgi:hypothetical protein